MALDFGQRRICGDDGDGCVGALRCVHHHSAFFAAGLCADMASRWVRASATELIVHFKWGRPEMRVACGRDAAQRVDDDYGTYRCSIRQDYRSRP